MTISLIVAASENNAIGRQGQLLWSLPIDLKFFKDTTWAMVVVMGRKTYESVDKPLPGRVNIVITKQADWSRPGTQVAKDLDDAIAQAKATNCKEIFIIGGGEIYRQSMDIADKIYMTRVHATLEGDTYFPEIDPSKWIMTGHVDFLKDEKHAYDFSFQTWEKKITN
ncbi:dihydrofolate reductase [Ferruginibacter sp. HRS2-29]|uniref:dihydrofolate reductase n=1 Tax=Ferruginibacter sp. HRS2-29 TaxID=2487334 RepID=UPI0020CD6ABF|nr:dihydrofolate reductase [Ferruginibacter sp. HRS2-29]MCP9753222.1 dihydrofolate reductase [Ferruginibacter sp. HRS2-29]